MRRFSLLPLASELVGLSTTHQEFEVVLEARHRKMKSVRYWGIIAILHDEKIKVVIRRMGKSRRTPELKTPPWAAFLVCLGSALPNGTLVPQAHTHYGTWNIKKSLKEF